MSLKYLYKYITVKGEGYSVYLYSTHTGDRKDYVISFRSRRDAARFCNRKNNELHCGGAN